VPFCACAKVTLDPINIDDFDEARRQTCLKLCLFVPVKNRDSRSKSLKGFGVPDGI
jgi:hypothetical protein